MTRNRAALRCSRKLRRRLDDAVNALARQIFQRRLATAGTRQRNIRTEGVGQRGRIDAHLQHIAMRFRAGEKCALARVHEDMQDRVFERGIGRVSVRLPISIGQIELDAAGLRFAAIDADGGAVKIGTGFAIPGAELHDFDFSSRRRSENVFRNRRRTSGPAIPIR